MNKIYTLFDNESGVVKSRMTVSKPEMIPEGELFVEGFFSTDWEYDFNLGAPVEVRKSKVLKPTERAFGDNIAMDLQTPYFSVHMWKRID